MSSLRHKSSGGTRGFTLIELMVVIAVAGVLAFLAAPSFRDMIIEQRLRSISSEILTDLQLARAEAASRNQAVSISMRSNTEMTCYAVYTAAGVNARCDCRLGAGAACTGIAGASEVKVHQLLRSTGVRMVVPASQVTSFSFEERTGGIQQIPNDVGLPLLTNFTIRAIVDGTRELQVQTNVTGRSTLCRPATSRMREAQC